MFISNPVGQGKVAASLRERAIRILCLTEIHGKLTIVIFSVAKHAPLDIQNGYSGGVLFFASCQAASGVCYNRTIREETVWRDK